jgi:hypothetical protein
MRRIYFMLAKITFHIAMYYDKRFQKWSKLFHHYADKHREAVQNERIYR